MRVVPRSARIGLAALAVLLAAGILLLFVRPDLAPEVRAPDEPSSVSDVSAAAASDPAEGEGSGARASSVQDVSEDRIALNRPPPVPLAQKKLEASGVPIAIFRGRLIYDSTEQGVPWCGVMLHGGDLQDLFCITDEEGRFASRYEMPLATTRIHLADDRGQCSYEEPRLFVHRESADEEVLLRCDGTPTVVIDGPFPDGLDPSTITYTTRAPGVSNGNLHLRMRDDRWFIRRSLDGSTFLWRHGDPRPDVPGRYERNLLGSERAARAAEIRGFLADRARIQSKEPIAPSDVRAAPGHPREKPSRVEATPEDLSIWKIRFECDTGLWRGTATLPGCDGVVTVHPEWRATGAIELRLVDVWRIPPPWAVSCNVYAESTGTLLAGCTDLLPSLTKKPRLFVGLDPGTYRIELESEQCERTLVHAAVRAGETSRIETRIACAEDAGSVRGTVTTLSGVAPIGYSGWRVLLSGSGWSANATLAPRADAGPWSAEFQFTAVPPSQFELSLVGCENRVVCSPEGNVRGGDSVRLTVDDTCDTIDIGFRAVDDSTGEALESLLVIVDRGGSETVFPAVASGDPVVRRFPSNGTLPWRVSSPGYQCASGTIVSSQAWSKLDGDARLLDVRLKRGWSVRCIAWDTHSGAGLAGATILVDGKPVGVTDAHGDFELALPARPASVEAEMPGWRRTTPDPTDLSEAESTQSVEFAFERSP